MNTDQYAILSSENKPFSHRPYEFFATKMTDAYELNGAWIVHCEVGFNVKPFILTADVRKNTESLCRTCAVWSKSLILFVYSYCWIIWEAAIVASSYTMPKKEKLMRPDSEFILSELVFAKMHGFCAWPARIIEVINKASGIFYNVCFLPDFQRKPQILLIYWICVLFSEHYVILILLLPDSFILQKSSTKVEYNQNTRSPW